MFLINRTAYQNAREERRKAVESLPFEISSDSATETAGAAGWNLQESAQDINGHLSDEIDDESMSSETSDEADKAIKTLVELGDILDLQGKDVYADFTDFLIKKVAQEVGKTPLQNFNDLIIKVNNTDLTETNDTIKKLTKIFSRTVLLEMSNHGDLEAAYLSAYKKTLNRADQYLSGGKMIKAASVYENPRIVADYIKGIIDVLVARFAPEAQMRSYPNIRNKIMSLNPSELSSKRSPGGAAIGVAITLIKNILNGRDPHFINLVISNLTRIL